DSDPQARRAGERRGLHTRGDRRRQGGGRMGRPRRPRADRQRPVNVRTPRATAPGLMKLLVGTRSAGKTREIRELFAGLPFELSFPADRRSEERRVGKECRSGWAAYE